MQRLDNVAHSKARLTTPTVVGAPLLLRIARTMSRAHMKGSGVLTRLLLRRGMLNVAAQYQLGDIKFVVPLYLIPWDLKDVERYESRFIAEFSRALAPLSEITFFDCGADIGTFSALLCARSNRITRIIAFEPSARAREFLEVNLSNLAVPSELILKAVSNFDGWGRLERSEYDGSDQAQFLAPGTGPLQVTTIDRMRVTGGDVAIKLDLEGGELAALQGSAQTIASARSCVVGLEASAVVKKRTGRDPVECLRFLESIRPFEFIIAETGERPDTSRPILSSGQTETWNVVGRSYGDKS
jgi:FkbM family methyltransferase